MGNCRKYSTSCGAGPRPSRSHDKLPIPPSRSTQETDTLPRAITADLGTPRYLLSRPGGIGGLSLSMARDSLYRLQRIHGNRYVRRMLGLSGDTAEQTTPNVEPAIARFRSGTRPLHRGARSRMSQAFNAEFSGDCVHTDYEADGLNSSLQTGAFTTGKDVYFFQGDPNLGSPSGRKSLAHVMQQGGNAVQSKNDRDDIKSTCGGCALISTANINQEPRLVAEDNAGYSGSQVRRRERDQEEKGKTEDHEGNVALQLYGSANKYHPIAPRSYNTENDAYRYSTSILKSDVVIQLSPLSDELERLWNQQGKGAFFDRLRQVSPVNDPDFVTFTNTLRGDDLWLTRNIATHGRERNWPIHLRVEREMKGWSDCGGKGAVFDILRAANGAESTNSDLTASLNRVFTAGTDDIWLATKLQEYGPEASWPIHLRVEREMKGWSDCGGKGAVFDILRAANGAESANADLSTSIRSVFAAGTQDRWLAQVIQALGPEGSWPAYLTSLWTDIRAGTMPVPTMEVSGAELVFEDIVLPNQTAYNCYEYAMGETTQFRQPGGGVPAGSRSRSGVLALLTSDMGSSPADCDTVCPSGNRKIMAVVTDDEGSAGGGLVRMETQPTRIIYWIWDFHFYRQDIGGIWSHKPGGTRHRLTDSASPPRRIVDPRSAVRRTLVNTGTIQFGRPVWRGLDYRNIVGCWCVPPGTR
jgi:hypothetical protein